MTSDNVRYVWPAAKAVRASNGASRADGRITPAGSPRYVDAAAENAQVRQRSGIDGPDRYVPVEWAPCELAGGFCILIAGHGGPCARAHDGPAPSHGGHCYSSGGTLVCGWPQFHARAIRSGAHL
jgi:hypothetical protein